MRGSRTSWKSPSSRSRPSSASKASSPTSKRTAAPPKRSTCARKTTRRSPPSSKRKPPARPKKRRVPPKRPRARPPKRRPQPPLLLPPRRPRRTRNPSARPGAAVGVRAAAPGPRARSRAPSTTAKRATACGWTPPCRTIPIYAEHWAGHRPVEITIEEDQIVIRRCRRRRGRRRRLIRAALPRSRGGARRIRLQCDVVEPWEHGSVLRTPSAPNFWDANFVRVEGDASDLEPLDARAGRRRAAGRLAAPQARGPGRGAPARGMRPFFEAAGWVADRNAVMLREGPAPAHADVEEVALLETRPLRVEWYLSYENDEAEPGGARRRPGPHLGAPRDARVRRARRRRLPGRLHDAAPSARTASRSTSST